MIYGGGLWILGVVVGVLSFDENSIHIGMRCIGNNIYHFIEIIISPFRMVASDRKMSS